MLQRMGERGQAEAARRPGGDARRGCRRPRWTAGGGWPRAGLGLEPRVVLLVVLVLAAALAGSPTLAQDLRFSGGAAALSLRSADPASPVLGRAGPLTAVSNFGNYLLTGSTLVPGITSTAVTFGLNGGDWFIRPTPAPDASRRTEIENGVTVLATRLNAAADGLFTSSQDTFVLEIGAATVGWTGNQWASASSSALATRFTAAFGAGRLTNWHLIAVDKNQPGVVIDDAGQRFLYQAPTDEVDSGGGGGGSLRPGSSGSASRRLMAA